MAIRKVKQEIAPNWRPNFRIAEALPDIKVIRTDFLVNFIAIALAVIILGVVVFKEIRGYTQRRERNDLIKFIEQKSAANQKALQQSAEFLRLSKNIEELYQFIYTPATPSELLMILAELRPEKIVLSHLSVSHKILVDKDKKKPAGPVMEVTLSGLVAGDSSIGTATVKEFSEALRNHAKLKGVIRDVNSVSFEPKQHSSTFVLVVILSVSRP